MSTSTEVVSAELTTQPPQTNTAIKFAAITKRPPGNTTGRVVINSCNFKNVTIEPVNETVPTITVNTVAIKIGTEISVPVLVASPPSFKYSTMATSAAAPPPTPLNKATSCGI